MNWKLQKLLPFTLLLFWVTCIGVLIYITGLVDYIPRLRVSAKSPDGQLIVRVYQQRLSPRPFFPQMGAVAKIYDKNEHLLYEKIIYHDDDWDDTVGLAYKEVSFNGEEILIEPRAYEPSNAYVIRKSDFK